MQSTLTDRSIALPIHHIREVPERFALIERFYREQGYKLKLSADECVLVSYILAPGAPEVQPTLVAAVRLLPQPSGSFWLRNLLVAKSARGQGIASELLRFCQQQLGAQACYCFALPHLEGFYSALGFSLNPDDCPADIQQRYLQYKLRGRDWLLMGWRSNTTPSQ